MKENFKMDLKPLYVLSSCDTG